MATLTACSSEKGEDPVGGFLKNIGANDPAAHLVSSPGLAASQGPDIRPEVVPEPATVTTPPERRSYRGWRHGDDHAAHPSRKRGVD